MLLQVPRAVKLDWFVPKLGYKLPSHGVHVKLSLINSKELELQNNVYFSHSNVTSCDDACDKAGMLLKSTNVVPPEQVLLNNKTSTPINYIELKELSGISLLDVTDNDDVQLDPLEEKENMETVIPSEKISVEEVDLLWYQAPINAKGFRYKMRESAFSDLWA